MSFQLVEYKGFMVCSFYSKTTRVGKGGWVMFQFLKPPKSAPSVSEDRVDDTYK